MKLLARRAGEAFEDYLLRLNAALAEAQRPRAEKLAALARRLTPRKPLPEYAVEAFRCRVLDEVLGIAHLPQPRGQTAVYRRIAAKRAKVSQQAGGITVPEPGYAEAQAAVAAWGKAAAIAKGAAAWGARRNGPPAKTPTRVAAPETRRIGELLALVRNVTGKPRHVLVGRMLSVAGRPTTAAWLRQMDPGRPAKKIV